MTNEEAVAYFRRHINLYCVTGICREAEEMAIKALSAEPCEDCISRQAVLAYIEFILTHGMGKKKSFEFIKKFVGKLPSVTPKHKMGRWINYQKNRWIYAQCSECGTVHDTQTNYCPNCGEKMGESEEMK